MHLRNKSFPLCMSITSCYSCPVSCSFARELFRINDIESPAYSGLPPRCSCDLHTGSRENQDHMHIKRSIKYYKLPYHHFQIIILQNTFWRRNTPQNSQSLLIRDMQVSLYKKTRKTVGKKKLQNTCIYRLSIQAESLGTEEETYFYPQNLRHQSDLTYLKSLRRTCHTSGGQIVTITVKHVWSL